MESNRDNEAAKSQRILEKRFPWCTIWLVACSLLCCTCVLAGNFKTAEALNSMGTSTGGWSKVGNAMAQSLSLELDTRLHEVSNGLIDSLLHITIVQEAIDTVLSLIGMEADDLLSGDENATSRGNKPKNSAATSVVSLNPHQVAFLQRAAAQHVSLLQELQSRDPTDAFHVLVPVIMDGVRKVLAVLMDKVCGLLNELMQKIKPAMQQVGSWLITFGDRVQSGLEVFSVTLDRVQKIFDQVMKKLVGNGDNEEIMLNQTFGLFDVSNTGLVTVQDLQNVSALYSITALQGDLAADLVAKYDASGDGQLDLGEMRRLVRDDSVPDIMSHVLRIYAKRLAQIGTAMGAARQRDEIAQTLVEYIGLVCAKNASKVSWVADRLGNGSLPLEFTADVLVEFCLTEDQTRLTIADVGALMTARMYDLHPQTTLAAVDLLSNSTFWVDAGFDPFDQPACLKRIATWVTHATSVKGSDEKALAAMPEGPVTDVLAMARQVPFHPSVLEALPGVAERRAKENMKAYLSARRRTCETAHAARFSSATSKILLDRLLGGASASDVGLPTAADQTISTGQPAKPETLEFARWLANNATQNAAMLQDMSFIYDSSSSNTLDSYASHIQTIVSSMQAFLSMMMRYATPAGLKRMEDQITTFTKIAMDDVENLIEKRIGSMLNSSSQKIDKAIHAATHATGEKLGRMIGHALANPLGHALTGPLQEIVGDMVHNPSFGDVMGEKLSEDIGQVVSNFTAEALAKSTGDLLDELVDGALQKGAHKVDGMLDGLDIFKQRPPRPKTSLLQRRSGTHDGQQVQEHSDAEIDGEELLARVRQGRLDEEGLPESSDQLPPLVTGAWEGLVNLMKGLSNMMPAAIKLLKNARKEVNKLRGDMENVFTALELRGPPIFEAAARFWRMIWMVYFICLLPLTGFMVYYAMWSGGYFGGPQPIPDEEQEASYAEPTTTVERLQACCMACSTCMKRYHDGHLCFWSTIICMEIVALVIFAVCIVLCLMAGIKVFMVQGCGEIFILTDNAICTEALHVVRDFLGTFLHDESKGLLYGLELEEACGNYNLLTCQMISNQMKTSMILTTVFSFLNTILTLQLIMDSAVRHEQATFRRLFTKIIEDEERQAAAPQEGLSAS